MRACLLIGWLALLVAGCNLASQDTVAEQTPTPAPDIPRVEFLQPPNETTVIEGTDIALDILATDAGVGVARIELLVDEQKINERGPDISAAVPSFRVNMNWLAVGFGRHLITAVAYRPDGTPSDPAQLVVNVLPPATAEPTP